MNKYRYFIIGLCLVFFLGSCKSTPKRELDSRTGVIAANFNLPREKVENLRKKELTEDEMIKLLIISRTTYLETGEVYERFSEGKELQKIGEEAGLSGQKLEEKFELVKENIENY